MNPMGWWRRNWVDTLMIGLILLVVGGFVSLLLRGTPGLNAANTSPTSNPTTNSSSSNTATTTVPSTATTTVPSTATTTVPSTSEMPAATTEGAASTSSKPATTQANQTPVNQTPANQTATSKPDASQASSNSSNTSSSGSKTNPDMTRIEPATIEQGNVAANKPSTPTTPAGKPSSSSDGAQAVSANNLDQPTSKADSPQLDSSEPAQTSDPAQTSKPTVSTVTLSKAPPKPARPEPVQSPLQSKASSLVETPVAPKAVVQVPAPRPTPNVSIAKPVAPRVVAKPSTSNPSRSVYLRSYRVAVGSFSEPSRAEKLASSLRSDGLPARAVRSGGKTVVIVGPYKSASQAQAAFDQVKNTHSDAILFKPNGSKIRANVVAPAPVSSDSTAKPEPDSSNPVTTGETSTEALPEATAGTPAPTAESVVSENPEKPQAAPQAAQVKPLGRYLQVGAFKDIASAGPMLSKLAKYGYRGTLDQGSDGLTRVLVGPYDTKTFENAKRNLRKRGFTVFAAK
jgi:cell division septation protein DedD